ncbi:hypothetical protein [Streptomyces sp. NPDC088256]|uniref:hypothetical protein n=1 Tax=Streptomyces sp. NPDC088256 TaxID=3365848 RepID=UPI00381AE214
MVTLSATDGGTVTVNRYGELLDIHVRDSSGRTIATVTRRPEEAVFLLSEIRRKSGHESRELAGW